MDAIDFLHGSCIVTALLVTLIDIAQSVPPEYCLHKLNVSDCGGPPTPVAYYYKPGSRCEIAIWRGCPTFNKFSDDVICSHTCIARIIKWSSNEYEFQKVNDNETSVLDYVYGAEWKHEMQLLSEDDMKIMDVILDEALSNDLAPVKVKLKHDPKENTSSTTEKAIEETSSPNTDTATDISTDTTTEETVDTETATTTIEAETTTEVVTTEVVTTEVVTTEVVTTEAVTVTVATESDQEIGDPDEVITT